MIFLSFNLAGGLVVQSFNNSMFIITGSQCLKLLPFGNFALPSIIVPKFIVKLRRRIVTHKQSVGQQLSETLFLSVTNNFLPSVYQCHCLFKQQEIHFCKTTAPTAIPATTNSSLIWFLQQTLCKSNKSTQVPFYTSITCFRFKANNIWTYCTLSDPKILEYISQAINSTTFKQI